MRDIRNNVKTLGDALELIEASDLTSDQRKDMKSAINRVSEMAGMVPAMAEANAPALRTMLKRVRPAAHEVKSPRRIAADLNAEHIPSPRGGQWNASTINGHRGRR